MEILKTCYIISMEEKKSFHAVDYVIFAATLVASMGIGLFFGFCKKKDFSSADYFFGGKQLRSLPVALSFVVTFQSSLLILGIPAETYGYGIKFVLEVIGIVISFVLGATVVPVFRPLQITSIYKYFNLRYGSNEVRFLAAAGGIIYFVFYMAAVVVGTCIALNSVMGIPFWATVLTYTLVTAIYTSLGGFKAVIWTDVFQLVVMVTGILATLIKSTTEAGGPSEIYVLAKSRFNAADFRMDPTLRYTFWILTFGPITQFLVMFFTQAGLQRIKSTPTARNTYWMLVISGPIYCIFATLTAIEGVSLFAYYSSIGCDPLASGRISNINEVVPTAVLDLFASMPGFPGLFIASLSSAALSTLSSCLTGLSSITFEDIIKVNYPDMSDRKATTWSKAAVFLYGAVVVGLAFIMATIPGPVTAMFQAFMGSIDGPTCGIFILSMFFLRSTTKGMVIGAVSGMLVSMTLNLGQTFVTIPSSEYLPLGPTDRCSVSNLTNVTFLDRNTTHVMEPVGYTYNYPTTVQSSWNFSKETSADQDSSTTILQKIFGISFMLFSLIGFLITAIVGFIASLLSKPTPREKVDLMTLFPLPDQFCSLFPEGFFLSRSDRRGELAKRHEELELMKQDQTEANDGKHLETLKHVYNQEITFNRNNI